MKQILRCVNDLKREIQSDLYDETLDIFEVNRREKIDVLSDKMVDFSDHLLKIVRIDFADVC